MRTIIAGSRSGFDFEDVRRVCETVGWDISQVILGTARGVDAWGETWARAKRIPIRRFPANWNRYGKAGGFYRNMEMAANADALIACWDGKSKGTGMMISLAEDRGLKVHVYIKGNA